MARLNDPENFIGRVDYAAAVIIAGSVTTREFDTCFENGDQAAVAAALMRRAENNPKLAEGMFRYIVKELAVEAHKQLNGRDLADAARELRDASSERLQASMGTLSQQVADAAARTR